MTRQEYKIHVEDITGGPNGHQVPQGGTCQRPDIKVPSGGWCDGCTMFEFCLVSSKQSWEVIEERKTRQRLKRKLQKL